MDSAENEGDGRVGWIGRDPEENKVAAARGKGGWDRLGLGFDLIFISEEFRLGANSSLRSKSDGQEK